MLVFADSQFEEWGIIIIIMSVVILFIGTSSIIIFCELKRNYSSKPHETEDLIL